MKNPLSIQKSHIIIAVYFSLSFFVLGVSAMLHYFTYLKFDCVHENISIFMAIFHKRIVFLFYIPSLLLLFFSILLFWFAPKNFSKIAIVFSTLLSITAIVTIFVFLIPIQNSFLPNIGFLKENYEKLLFYNLRFQLIPIFLQSIIALYFLNLFLNDLKYFSRWLFIIIFFLAFYTAGSDVADKFNYPTWLVIGKNEWFTFRNSHKSPFFLFGYLLPAFLPLILVPMLFRFRSKAIQIKFILIYFSLYIFISVVSAIYFVPKVQLKLNKIYSIRLINDLIINDLLLRLLPSVFIYGLAFYMLLVIKKTQSNHLI